MGVHGLTTYLRENHRVLSKVINFPSTSDDVNSIVVDGWSFIYELYEQSKLPWVYGGEYEAFSACVECIVKAWIAVGLTVYFVFDGSAPELKIPTLVSRLNHSIIERSLLFFRTSPASRSTPRFLHETRMIPPLAYHACLHTLREFASLSDKLEVHFADEEGDPYAVELAGRLGAFVIGNDSDFVILNSGKYAGYIQFDDMLWAAPNSVDADSGGEEGEFRIVKKTTIRKKNGPQRGASRGLIPPDHDMDLTLSVSAYAPVALASHFKIPVTLLPLLGALVGNDFSNQSSTQRNVQNLFFERRLTLSQRITRVGSTLNGILCASTQKRKARHEVGSVMDLIDRSVHALLIKPPSTMASGQIDVIVDRIVNAALQYAIDKYEGDTCGPEGLWPSKICALHRPQSCRLPVLFSNALSVSNDEASGDKAGDGIQFLQLRSLYIAAYRSGNFQPKLTDILNTGTFWPKLFLENPDAENVARSIGRPIRKWICAILEDSVGLPKALEETEEESAASQEDEDNEDELIDVVEEDSEDDGTDLLAPLRGELRKLRVADEEPDVSASITSRLHSSPQPKYVTEYVRRGTRVAPEEVMVPDIRRLLAPSALHDRPENWTPLPLRPASERVSVFLHALRSSTAAIEALPSEQLMSALVLRWVVQMMHVRATESTSKEREKERWTKLEAGAFLAFHTSQGHRLDVPTQHVPGGSENKRRAEATPMNDRSIQLMSQVLMAIESIHHLSQVLLVSDRVPIRVHVLSGQTFHMFLSQQGSNHKDFVPRGLWDACMEGLGDAFAEERPVKARKPKVAKQAEPAVETGVRGGTRGSQFGLLAELLE